MRRRGGLWWCRCPRWWCACGVETPATLSPGGRRGIDAGLVIPSMREHPLMGLRRSLRPMGPWTLAAPRPPCTRQGVTLDLSSGQRLWPLSRPGPRSSGRSDGGLRSNRHGDDLDSQCHGDLGSSAGHGGNRRPLNLGHPRRHELFWTDAGSGALHRTARDGSGDVTLASGLTSPGLVTADDTRVYWFEPSPDSPFGDGGGMLRSLPLDAAPGEMPAGLAAIGETSSVFSMVAAGGSLYWTPYSLGSTMYYASLVTAPVATLLAGGTATVVPEIAQPYALVASGGASTSLTTATSGPRSSRTSTIRRRSCPFSRSTSMSPGC